MKKIFFFFLLIISHNVKAQNVSPDFVNIANSSNMISVSFSMPNYAIVDTCLNEDFQNYEVFNYIKVSANGFGEVTELGLPQLPQLTLGINVPKDSYNYNLTVTNIETTTINITNRILPFQDVEMNENNSNDFIINNDFYSSNGELLSFRAQLSDPYIIMGEKGIDLTILPFLYNPIEKKATLIKRMSVKIEYQETGITEQVRPISLAKKNIIKKSFDNYSSTENRAIDNAFLGNYLIITPPVFENDLTYFANYKRNLGYKVKIANTNTIGNTSALIKNYIQNQYNTINDRPDFILLVGDVNLIPFAEGVDNGDDKNHPVTDLSYVRLDGNDYFADALIGRFSVNNISELRYIINKTIFMELNMHLLDKKVKVLVGDGTRFSKRNWTNSSNDIIKESLQPNRYLCQKMYQWSQNDVELNLIDNPLMIVYSGHGNVNIWGGGTFNLYNSFYSNSSNSVFPLVFAFSCLTGNFANPNYTSIGESWLRSKTGICSYFGSSISVFTKSDCRIKECIFKAINSSNYLSGIINIGMKKYYNKNFTIAKRARRYLQSFNLLGDPSLCIRGIGNISNLRFEENELFNYGNSVNYFVENNIETSALFKLENGSDITLQAGKAIILKPGFHARIGSNFHARICNTVNRTLSKSIQEQAPDNLQVSNNTYISPEIFNIYPNPFSDEISITYAISQYTDVVLELYDISGKIIKLIYIEKKQIPGIYNKTIQLENLPQGIYFYKFSTIDEKISGKLIKQ